MLPRERDLFVLGPLRETRVHLEAHDLGGWAETDRQLVADCHPRQRWLVEDTSTRIAANVPRGWGKTTAVLARTLRRLRKTNRARVLYIATSRTQGEVLIWEPLKKLNERLKLGLKFNETKMSARLPRTGGTFRIVGADDKREIEKLRGMPHHEVWIDEAASHPKHILDALILRIIGPRLGDYRGTLGMVGTPGHVLSGFFYEVTRLGSDSARHYVDRDQFPGWIGWSVHTGILSDNTKAGHEERSCPAGCEQPHLWEEALIEKERNGWTDQNPIWRREYLAEWCADDTENVYKYRPHVDGQAWNQWDPPRDAIGFARPPEGHRWHYVYGADMGFGDPFALEVFAYSDTYPKLLHVYEFSRKGMYTRLVAELIKGPECVRRILADEQNVPVDPQSIMFRTGYPSGAAADIAGSGMGEVEELGRVYGIAFEPAPRGANDKHSGIELFNGDLIDGRILIIKGSKLEEQLLTLQWAIDDFGKLKEHKSQRNDCTDAAIMARRKALHLFTRAPAAEQPAPGSREATDRDARESVERLAKKHQDGLLGGLTGPESYDEFFPDLNGWE